MTNKQVGISILKDLTAAGHQAYFVGGAVRDTILEREPKDWDIATSATADEILNIFSKEPCLTIGKAFGIVTVIRSGINFEIATFRKDGQSIDNRHPDSVEFVGTIEEDLSRRDFTMNAMAMEKNGHIIDPFNGRKHIKSGKIHFVGNPSERIDEDNLRVLRAFRFMSQFGMLLGIDDYTAIKYFAQDNKMKVSNERIQQELVKIITGDEALCIIDQMAETGILWQIIPELKEQLMPHNSKHHREEFGYWGNTIWSHTLHVFKAACTKTVNFPDVEKKFNLRMAALLHDIGKPWCEEKKSDGTSRYLLHDQVGAGITSEILKRLKFDNETVRIITEAVKNHMNIHDLPKMKKWSGIRKMLGHKDIGLILDLAVCDTIGTDSETSPEPDCRNLLMAVDKWRKEFPEMLPHPIMTGQHLIDMGLKPGPIFSKILEAAYDFQLNGEYDLRKIINRTFSAAKSKGILNQEEIDVCAGK